MHIYLNTNLILFFQLSISLSLGLFLPLQKQESFLAKESIKELEKKKQQQNDSFSIVFKERILPWVYLWKANEFQRN